MRFTEDYWCLREDVAHHYAAHAYDIEKIPNGMRVYAPCRAIHSLFKANRVHYKFLQRNKRRAWEFPDPALHCIMAYNIRQKALKYCVKEHIMKSNFTVRENKNALIVGKIIS